MKHGYGILLEVVVFVTVTCMSSFAGSHAIDYVPERSEGELVRPIEVSEICAGLPKLLGLVNTNITEAEIITWAAKKNDADKPPILIEEIFIVCRVVKNETNLWAAAYLIRSAGRGVPGYEYWHPGHTAKGMDWLFYSSDKPAAASLGGLLKRSNFGYNECNADIVPVHVAVYAPYKSLCQSVSKGISKKEKAGRHNTMSGVLRDPPDAFKK